VQFLCSEEGLSMGVALAGFIVMSAYIEEVKLINSGSNAPREQQDIALQPCDGLGGILV